MVRLFILIIPLLIIPINAYAYLDLGTASYLVQIILAALAGALFSVKMFWSRIGSFFSQLFIKRKLKNQNSSDTKADGNEE